MVVKFYKNKSDNRVLNKNIELITTLNNVVFKEDANKGATTIELSYNASIVNNANYCYIEDLHYYYYLSEPTYGKQRVYFDISTDLRMTFKDDILNLDCIVERQENKYNAYLKDDKLPVENRQDVNTIDFEQCFVDPQNEYEQILLVVNGGA